MLMPREPQEASTPKQDKQRQQYGGVAVLACELLTSNGQPAPELYVYLEDQDPQVASGGSEGNVDQITPDIQPPERW
jgi:hypothetical protein